MTAATTDRSVPSDGLTLDTPRGPVDLVAIERVWDGVPTDLTRAESIHLTGLLDGSRDQARRIAHALGCDMWSVLKRVDRRRAAAGP